MNVEIIESEYDGLKLEIAFSTPNGKPKGIVQFSHGMAEHKERYYDFMNYLTRMRYVCVIHDHRGHGESVYSSDDYGYFYTENEQAIIEDLYTVTKLIKKRYPGLPVLLFSHSMGTLVARGYMKKYDSEIEKIVLCGPPTRNPAVGIGLVLAKILKHFYSEKEPNGLLNNLAFKSFNTENEIPNSWISASDVNVSAYNSDPKCGFIFTTNGFINLFKLQRDAFVKKGWKVDNSSLPIFIIAGAEDPVIRSKTKFVELAEFLSKLGYGNIKSKLYAGMSHEILNEAENDIVYKDIADFFNED